jgi:N-acetylneuraminate synthase
MNGIDISKKIFIIAEAGVNHNGRLDLAYKLVDVAREVGADAIKFQTFKAEKLVSSKAPKAEYQKKTTGSDESQLEMIRKLELSFEDFIKLKKYCEKKGIMFLSTPFDHQSIDFLYNLLDIYKIPSGEIINYPYLRHIASKNKPIIMSTGMANLGEVEEAINTIRTVNSKAVIYLLHCTTNYPASYEETNLKAMQTLLAAFKLPVGYSDHTSGIEVPIAAAALGARIIEKHFTLDKKLFGPDHKASLEPGELKEMIKAIRNIEKALGDGIKKPNQSEIEIIKVARKSLIAGRDIKAGEIIKESDVIIKRPGTGIPPKFQEIVVGMRILNDVSKDDLFKWEDFK